MQAFMNVYNVYNARNARKAVIVAAPVKAGKLLSVLRKAYYEHGLQNPDYTVFQTEQQARDAA